MTMSTLGDIAVEGDRYGLTLVRRLAAGIQDVWSAITEPAELEEWLSTTELEPTPGGQIRIDFGGNDVVEGTVRTFDPPHVFEFTWSLPSSDDDPSVVRFELREEDDETVLTLTHRRQIGRQARLTAAGWHTHIDVLDGYLRSAPVTFETRHREVSRRYEPIIAELLS